MPGFFQRRSPASGNRYVAPVAAPVEDLAGSTDLTITPSGTLTGTGVLAGTCVLTLTPAGILAGEGSLAGTAALVFADAALLAGTAALAGTSALGFTDAGTLTGTGALAGSVVLALANAGVLDGAGVLTGTSDLTFALTAILTAEGSLAGTSAVVLSPTGLLDGAGTLLGAALLVFAPTATATGAGFLAGTSDLTLAVSGTLELPSGEMAGTAALVFTSTATLTGAGVLAGTSVSAFTLSAMPAGDGALAGTCTLTLTPTGTLTGEGALAGTAALTLTPAGTVTGSGALSGSAALTFVPGMATSTLTGDGVLAGSAVLALSPTGTLTGDGVLLGTTVLAFSLSGTLDLPSGEMAGAVALAFAATSTLTGDGAILGTSDLTFAPAATLDGAGTLTGAAALTFAATGTLAGDGMPPDAGGAASTVRRRKKARRVSQPVLPPLPVVLPLKPWHGVTDGRTVFMLLSRGWTVFTVPMPAVESWAPPKKPRAKPAPKPKPVPQPTHWLAEGRSAIVLEAVGQSAWYDLLPALRISEDAILLAFGVHGLVRLAERHDVGLEGRAGSLLGGLLSSAIDHGRQVLESLTRRAIKRGLAGGWTFAAATGRLLDDRERNELAETFAATSATASLLGRALVRDRWQRTLSSRGLLRESLAVMQESLLSSGPPPILSPVEALDYFRGLVPTLGVDPQRFGLEQQRKAFTLAVATDLQLVQSVQTLIAERIRTGQRISDTPDDIDALLDAAGVSERNSGYAEAVWRTNALDSYNTGADTERMAPDVISYFPVWRYSNPDDGRSRPHHAAKDGNYYPAHVPFTVVRGTEARDVVNCRCVPVEIFKDDWIELKRQGARIAAGYPDV